MKRNWSNPYAVFTSTTTLTGQLSSQEVERKFTSHMITSAFPSGDFSAALKYCLWTWLIVVQKISFQPSIDFQFSIFIFHFIFKSHFCEMRPCIVTQFWCVTQLADGRTQYISRHIPHICHGSHGYTRVNFFGRCKFLQIQRQKLAFSTDFTRKSGVFLQI